MYAEKISPLTSFGRNDSDGVNGSVEMTARVGNGSVETTARAGNGSVETTARVKKGAVEMTVMA